MNGYCGKLLRVDLDKGVATDVPLDPAVARAYVGGSGVAAHVFLEEVAPALEGGSLRAAAAGPRRPDPGVGYPDPFGPDNPLIIMAGPLTGARLPAAARFTVSARSPLTGVWGEANSGGHFGAELRFAGYDGVVITGRAASPQYLLIEEGRASLEPAESLWGKDTYETHDLLTARSGGGGRRAQALVIGPAGENLVRFACIHHGKHHAAGRTGMGAVMGSKNLKAVVVRGAEGRLPPPADGEALKKLAGELLARVRESMMVKTMSEVGTIASMDIGALIGDVPIANWTRGAWDGLEKLGTAPYSEQLTGTSSCYACPIGCYRKVTVSSLGREVRNEAGAEYETLAMLGANLLVSDLAAVQVLGDACNRLGLDTISTGGTLGFALEAADAGLLDGFAGSEKLKRAWGDAARVLELIEDMAYRRGIGDRLAEGSAALARGTGRPEAEALLATVKGLEAPAHDPRAAHGMGIAYVAANRGACHMGSMMFNLEITGYVAPEVGLDYDGMQQVSTGKGLMQRRADDFGCVFGQAAVLCHLGGTIYTPGDLLAALNAVTGFGYTMDEMLECGARIWHLKRGIGNLYGLRREDDRLPARLMEPLEDGGAAGSVPDMEAMLAEWYEARGLDAAGRARREVLETLGLRRLADLLDAVGDSAA